MPLPIDPILPDVISALRQHKRAVLQAPPGAGKTTRVPLALLKAGICPGKIVMLEPRRLAARAAAERMAHSLGEPVGETVGYRIRGQAKVSRETRIDVVTEGILTRQLQSDPELSGVGAVIFDEFHERSLNADVGLAFCLEVAEALRDDLHLLVMSATLDADPVARMMSAPILTSEGRSFPVDVQHLTIPRPKGQRFETGMAELIQHAVAQTEGGVLAFLPGEGEIRRVEGLLNGALPPECHVTPLFGALPFDAQQAAIRPARTGRKVVLATSIAETSLTIEDVRVVVDGGLARRARYDPGSGMSRLVTERVSRAEATQRAGRAGRVAPGTAYKLWTKGEDGALPAFPPAEIETADLTGLALELAVWGGSEADLAFLTPPPEGTLAEARAVLHGLGALDAQDRITPHGRDLAARPTHPRLAHMLATAGAEAAPLAALLSDRDPLIGAPSDLTLRIEALRDPKTFAARRPYQINRAALARIRDEGKRLSKGHGTRTLTPAQMAALAYPDRIALRRTGDAPRFVLSGGKGALLPADDPLAGQRLLVVTDTDGNPREARIRQAIPISEAELRDLFPDQIHWHNVCLWSKRHRKVMARQQERLGALVLDDRIWSDAHPETLARAMLEGVAELGLPSTPASDRFRARVAVARAGGLDLPDMTEPALLASLADWLLPHLTAITSAEAWKRFDILPALTAMLDWPQQSALDTAVPGQFTTPLGRKIPIDYSGEAPEIALRLQELFGQTTHPRIAGQPLRVTLLSPAGRPVQTTMDLPGFWSGSYADVRKEMRARYPKHPWPEDPTQLAPTLRAKPRK